MFCVMSRGGAISKFFHGLTPLSEEKSSAPCKGANTVTLHWRFRLYRSGYLDLKLPQLFVILNLFQGPFLFVGIHGNYKTLSQLCVPIGSVCVFSTWTMNLSQILQIVLLCRSLVDLVNYFR